MKFYGISRGVGCSYNNPYREGGMDNFWLLVCKVKIAETHFQYVCFILTVSLYELAALITFNLQVKVTQDTT